MKDVLPELLEKVEKEFEKEFEKSKIVLQVLEKVKNRQATYKEANKFAVEVGEILSKSFEHNISADVLPDGRMYYNIAERLLNKTLGNNHDIISKTCANIQTNLNKNAKINIKGIAPELNQDRIDGLIEKVVKADNYDDVSWVLREPVVNFSQSIVNDSIEVNSDFHHNLGLKAQIIRKSTGRCCDWCNKLAGAYEYPDVPKDVYRVHQYCRCTVDYVPGDGKKQDVHSRKWLDKEAEQKRNERIKKQGQILNRKNNNKLRRIAYAKAKELGYDPLPYNKAVNTMRNEHDEWISSLLDSEKNAITKYSFNGTDKDGKKWFEKINGYLESYYTPKNSDEKGKIAEHYFNIKKALLKNDLKHDIIVYRNESNFKYLKGNISKFLSTSVTTKGVFKDEANVAIIVPKGTRGAYIEMLSKKRKQREFLLLNGFELKEHYHVNGMKIYEVIRNE